MGPNLWTDGHGSRAGRAALLWLYATPGYKLGSMSRKFTSWVIGLRWRPALTLIGTIVLAWGIGLALNTIVGDNDTRDIGFVVVCVVAIVGFFAALILSPWVRGGDVASAAPASEPVDIPDELILVPPATGETVIGDVTHINAVNGDAIDYLPGDRESYHRLLTRTQRLQELLRLNLGEMALLRRLAVAQQDRDYSRRCQTVLSAAGVQKPDQSISRLEDIGLIHVAGDWINLHDNGREVVWAFTQCLIHDPELVTAYRQVTPQIDRAIRLDGEPLRHSHRDVRCAGQHCQGTRVSNRRTPLGKLLAPRPTPVLCRACQAALRDGVLREHACGGRALRMSRGGC